MRNDDWRRETLMVSTETRFRASLRCMRATTHERSGDVLPLSSGHHRPAAVTTTGTVL